MPNDCQVITVFVIICLIKFDKILKSNLKTSSVFVFRFETEEFESRLVTSKKQIFSRHFLLGTIPLLCCIYTGDFRREHSIAFSSQFFAFVRFHFNYQKRRASVLLPVRLTASLHI